jgi:hypothetical protein
MRSRPAAFLLIVALLCAVGLAAGRAKEVSKLSPEKAAPAPPATASRDDKTAEQVYKNIQVFKGVPASQLDASMAFIAGSLGVKCSHCHVPGQFEKDEKPPKQTARKMILMVFDLNKGSFDGRGAVTCFTCHKGRPVPQSVPPVGQNPWNPVAGGDAPPPTVEEILDHYVRAVGGRLAVEKVTSRVSKGSRVGADGVLVPEEVYAKAPNKLLTVTSYPDLVFRTGFNGAQGWARSSQGGRELTEEMMAQLRREAEFYKETRLKEMYSKLVVLGREKVREREAYVVEATPAGAGGPEKLYFDAQTGLLVRKYVEMKTVVGQFPTQTDYEDYREVDGVKLPFTLRWSIPGRVWGRKITEVRHNVPLDDAQFNSPAAGK